MLARASGGARTTPARPRGLSPPQGAQYNHDEAFEARQQTVMCGRSYGSRTTRGAGVAGSKYDGSSSTHACRSPVDALSRQPLVDVLRADLACGVAHAAAG
jgi:hypothetical protein